MSCICAVVVTYNRKNKLLKCINSLLNQTQNLSKIYIIDNASTDGTEDLLIERGFLDYDKKKENYLDESYEVLYKYIKFFQKTKIIYYKLAKNYGGSGGFNFGIKRAYDDGCEWIWIMDDDAFPESNCLSNLLNYKELALILAPLVINSNGEIINHHRGFLDERKIPKYPLIQEPFYHDKNLSEVIPIEFSSFVGPLIHREVIKRVGLPDKDFFIYHDDVEFFLRVKKYGFKILLIKSAKIIHDETSFYISKSFMKRQSMRIPKDKLYKLYYNLRNITFINSIYSTSKYIFYYKTIVYFLRVIIGVLLYDDHKLYRLKFIIKSFIYALKMKKEKEDKIHENNNAIL